MAPGSSFSITQMMPISLLVLCNRMDPGPSRLSLLVYIPQTSNGMVLVTSRNSNDAFSVTGNCQNMIIIGPMDTAESMILMEEKLGSQSSDADSLDLVQALDRIPLAITQAAAYVSRRAPRMSVAKYLHLLHESKINQSRILGRYEGDLRRDLEVLNAVISTWQISFDQIGEENPLAANLLSLISVLNRQSISESLLRGHGDRLAFEDALNMLSGFALIVEESSGNSFGMHWLVQLATKGWLDVHGEIVKWNQETLSRIAEAFPRCAFRRLSAPKLISRPVGVKWTNVELGIEDIAS
jgi:hypothetical protein